MAGSASKPSPPSRGGETSERRHGSSGAAIRQLLERNSALLYAIYSASLTLVVACTFYASLHQQTQTAELWQAPQRFDAVVRGTTIERWSAPLDDVFIHFDFARATARGFPFQWSEGNGYSSGGTSLLYPFVLALGYVVGFRGLGLMLWAGVVACVCVFATLLGARRMFRHLPAWTAWLAPPALLGVGALNWTLWSGMEVALFLSLWMGLVVTWDEFIEAALVGRATRLHALFVGVVGALVVGTRPEGAIVVAILGTWAAVTLYRRRGLPAGVWTLVLTGLPGALIVIGHAIANHVLTGDSSAAGALAKLEIHHPYLSSAQVFDAWLFHVGYQVLRVTHYHFTDFAPAGWIPWVFAALSLGFRATRRYAIILWAGAISWTLIVALNGQVRWQNERYTMPAVAWLLLASALGLGALLHACTSPIGESLMRRRSWKRSAPAWAAASLAFASMLLFALHQAPRYRDQLWFFGRASRNILDQHVQTGWLLRAVEPQPRRILLSDAGAIPYASDLPALDLIGLGGYRNLPFARASRFGVGAAVELIEHVPPGGRPDVMALYPSWWGTFPLWFGHEVAEVPVRGNVICGGASKVIYQPEWMPIEHSGDPFGLGAQDRLIDALDVADLLSEEAHDASIRQDPGGWVGMKMLPDPRSPRDDLWDAGRTLSPGADLDFALRSFDPDQPARLLFRVAPAQGARFGVQVDGSDAGIVELLPADAWQELTLDLPKESVEKDLAITVRPLEGSFTLYHVFASQRRADRPSPETTTPVRHSLDEARHRPAPADPEPVR